MTDQTSQIPCGDREFVFRCVKGDDDTGAVFFIVAPEGASDCEVWNQAAKVCDFELYGAAQPVTFNSGELEAVTASGRLFIGVGV